jgi:hypothetical protein
MFRKCLILWRSLRDSNSCYSLEASIVQAAKDIAEEILDGSVSPYDGSYRIWKECHFRFYRVTIASTRLCIPLVKGQL